MNPWLVLWAALMGLLVLVFGVLLLNVLAIDVRSPLGMAILLGLLVLGLVWVLQVARRRRGR
ncbi:hypothetical protein [uncultured Meiothermus sp.]|jgi:hypothetical protein|uniref:hypothetical protein n=1 Tax=uncultured Meiothermus sp. TaxID=157471 RepID=UPI00261B6DD9|nr:hypothetical protein [uncultured Meiothermus sp.]